MRERRKAVRVRILSYTLCPDPVKTASGARAVQIVHGAQRGARRIEHLGSAHDELELEAPKAAARIGLALRTLGSRRPEGVSTATAPTLGKSVW
jgi:hypothetical protein